jgi:prevent-host-death family protein
MEQIGLFDAKNRLSELVTRVKKGERITITRHGHPEAVLVPAMRTFDREKARKAIERMRKLRKKLKVGRFDWKEWKRYRDEGRP